MSFISGQKDSRINSTWGTAPPVHNCIFVILASPLKTTKMDEENESEHKIPQISSPSEQISSFHGFKASRKSYSH
jgi:hypothetical protein